MLLQMARVLRGGGGGGCPVMRVDLAHRRMYPATVLTGKSWIPTSRSASQGGWYMAWGILWGYYYQWFQLGAFSFTADSNRRYDGSQFNTQRLLFGSRYDEPAEYVRVLPLSSQAPK
ncbi:unnamed protein product [Amoebophrya sp. A25]|nr:unnamed protein product [Amoebophrya sp. A25]|eukprot:GSA25T00025518001.1